MYCKCSAPRLKGHHLHIRYLAIKAGWQADSDYGKIGLKMQDLISWPIRLDGCFYAESTENQGEFPINVRLEQKNCQ